MRCAGGSGRILPVLEYVITVQKPGILLQGCRAFSENGDNQSLPHLNETKDNVLYL